MAEQMAGLNKNNYPRVILQETGSVDFPVSGVTYTTKSQAITESGFYFMTYSQAGPITSSVWSVISINGVAIDDRIAQVHVATPGGSPSAESCVLVKLSAGDTVYFTRVSAGATSTSDRAYNISIVKIA